MIQATDTIRRPDEVPGVGRVLVVIPTYNEADNIAAIVGRVRRAVPAVQILIADDNSPDGTGAIADALADGDAHVQVLHRRGKQGLGAAYLAGFAWARERGYHAVVEMDADGSHAPEDLPALLDAAARRRRGDRLTVDQRRAGAQLAAATAAAVARRQPVRAPGAGHARLGRHRRLPGVPDQRVGRIDLESVTSQGYSFQVELSAGRTGPGSGSWRCRSPSPSGNTATAR